MWARPVWRVRSQRRRCRSFCTARGWSNSIEFGIPRWSSDAVVGVFDLPPRPGAELLETLVNFLRPKQLLLLLDNCEHLLAPVARLVRALEGECPRARRTRDEP